MFHFLEPVIHANSTIPTTEILLKIMSQMVNSTFDINEYLELSVMKCAQSQHQSLLNQIV